jgi:hypothetical protein
LVDEVFAKLAARYGVKFQAQWQDMDPEYIKADWSEVLSGFERIPEAIVYALQNLPDTPVNATQFRAIARRAPMKQLMRLPEPDADPAKVAKALSQAKAVDVVDPRTPAQKVVDGIIERVKANDGWTKGQRDFMARCITVIGVNDPRRERLRRLGLRIEEQA